MADKVQKIKEWISKTQDGLMDANGNFGYLEHEGAYNILCNLDAYIDSMQKECNIIGIKSKHATGKLKECIDNVSEEGLEQARKQLEENPQECMCSKDNYTDEDRKALCDGCEEECRFNKKEESVSEDLEQAAEDYADKHPTCGLAKTSFIIGAQWQNEQLMAKAIDGIVHHHVNCKVASVYYNDPDNVPMAYYIPSEGVSAGDKVKIILVKNDK